MLSVWLSCRRTYSWPVVYVGSERSPSWHFLFLGVFLHHHHSENVFPRRRMRSLVQSGWFFHFYGVVVCPGNLLFLLPALGSSIIELSIYNTCSIDCWSPSGEWTLPQADLRAVLEVQVLRFEICSFRGVIVL
jgi:hypothetical protein